MQFSQNMDGLMIQKNGKAQWHSQRSNANTHLQSVLPH